jgi:hypothetical protein
MSKALIALLALAVAAGCGASSEPANVAADQALSIPSDAALKDEIDLALRGLSTGGGEGDPDPYKLLIVDLPADHPMTDAVLLGTVLPKMIPPPGPTEGMIPGLDSEPIDRAWAGVTADPNPNDYDTPEELAAAREEATKWRGMKQIFDGKLTGVKCFDMGYRSSPEGTLETGAVAHVFVGRSSSGALFAIWGIDIWT